MTRRARLGFVGVGWIGLRRLRAVVSSASAEIVAIADANADAARHALEQVRPWAPEARAASFEHLLESEIDGVVIATPNGEHAAQTRAALEHGHAVFCQKPLARTYAEAREIVSVARAKDRLLEVDFCYRRVPGVEQMKKSIDAGALGQIFAAELMFHNAYGPDKPWFYDLARAGGGCLMDLGIHLVDLLLWMLGDEIDDLRGRLYQSGALLRTPTDRSEDYALAELHLRSGTTARLACSWRLSAGCDAVIEATFYGTRGAVRLRNVAGSFYDFSAEHCEGTQVHTIGTPVDSWGDIRICEWARQVAADPRFDTSAERLPEVHRVLDAIYGR